MSLLTVLEEAEPKVSSSGRKYRQKRCRCSCGREVVVQLRHLKSGHTKSCGCFHRDVLSKKFTRHGLSNTGTQRSYSAMKQRCYNPHHISYPFYGARGVKVCKRWLNSFENFLADMGPRPEGFTLDRHPNEDGNYEPNNCRWVDRSENSAKAGRRNNRG